MQKNIGMINAAIKNAIDNTKLVDHSGKTAKRIGLIFNIPEDMEDSIDINGSELISKFGTPYEMYTHIQHTESNPYIKWIVAGMNLPIDHVRGIVDTYKETAASINKGKDSFFDIIDDFESGIDGIDMDMLDIVAPSNTKSNNDTDPIRTLVSQFIDMH